MSDLTESVKQAKKPSSIELLIDSYRPSETLIPVPLDRGQLLLFRAYGGISSWEKLMRDGIKWAERLKGKRAVEAAHRHPSDHINATCYVLAETMDCWYHSFEMDDDGNFTGVGHKEDAWDKADWLKFANAVSAKTFTQIATMVDRGQTASSQVAFVGALDAEGND